MSIATNLAKRLAQCSLVLAVGLLLLVVALLVAPLPFINAALPDEFGLKAVRVERFRIDYSALLSGDVALDAATLELRQPLSKHNVEFHHFAIRRGITSGDIAAVFELAGMQGLFDMRRTCDTFRARVRLNDANHQLSGQIDQTGNNGLNVQLTGRNATEIFVALLGSDFAGISYLPDRFVLQATDQQDTLSGNLTGQGRYLGIQAALAIDTKQHRAHVDAQLRLAPDDIVDHTPLKTTLDHWLDAILLARDAWSVRRHAQVVGDLMTVLAEYQGDGQFQVVRTNPNGSVSPSQPELRLRGNVNQGVAGFQADIIDESRALFQVSGQMRQKQSDKGRYLALTGQLTGPAGMRDIAVTLKEQADSAVVADIADGQRHVQLQMALDNNRAHDVAMTLKGDLSLAKAGPGLVLLREAMPAQTYDNISVDMHLAVTDQSLELQSMALTSGATRLSGSASWTHDRIRTQLAWDSPSFDFEHLQKETGESTADSPLPQIFDAQTGVAAWLDAAVNIKLGSATFAGWTATGVVGVLSSRDQSAKLAMATLHSKDYTFQTVNLTVPVGLISTVHPVRLSLPAPFGAVQFIYAPEQPSSFWRLWYQPGAGSVISPGVEARLQFVPQGPMRALTVALDGRGSADNPTLRYFLGDKAVLTGPIHAQASAMLNNGHIQLTQLDVTSPDGKSTVRPVSSNAWTFALDLPQVRPLLRMLPSSLPMDKASRIATAPMSLHGKVHIDGALIRADEIGGRIGGANISGNLSYSQVAQSIDAATIHLDVPAGAPLFDLATSVSWLNPKVIALRDLHGDIVAASSGKTLQFQKVNVQTGGISLAYSAQPVGARISIDSRTLGEFLQTMRVIEQPLDRGIAGLPLHAAGTYTSTAQGFDLDGGTLHLGNLDMAGNTHAIRRGEKFSATGNITASMPDIDPTIAKGDKPVTIDTAYHLDENNNLDLAIQEAKIADARVSGKMAISNVTEEGSTIIGKVARSSGALTFSVPRVQWGQVTVFNVTGNTNWNKRVSGEVEGNFVLNDVAVFGGVVGGALKFGLDVTTGALSFSQIATRATNIDLSSVCRDTGWRLFGSGSLSANFEGIAPTRIPLEQVIGPKAGESILARTTGAGHIRIDKGTLLSTDLEQDVPNSETVEISAGRNALTPFRTLDADFRLGDSTVTLDKGQILTNLLDLTPTGKMRIPDLYVDVMLRGSVIALRSAASDKDVFKLGIIPLQIRGAPDALTYNFLPGLAPTGNSAIHIAVKTIKAVDSIDRGINRAQRSVDEKVTEFFFRPVFGKKAPAPQPSPSASQKSQCE